MKKILISLLAIALVIGLVGAGVTAFFSDTGTSTANTFTTGTLVLQLADADEGWADGVWATWASPAGWAPGESFTSTLSLKNTGSVGAHAVYENWTNLVDPNGLSNWIQVTEISDSIPWSGGTNLPYGDNYVGNWIIHPIDLNDDGKLSLYELASWGDWKVTSGSPRPWDIRVTSSDVPTADPDALPAGGTLGLRFTFKLMDETTMQGATCTIDLNVMASQVLLPAIP